MLYNLTILTHHSYQHNRADGKRDPHSFDRDPTHAIHQSHCQIIILPLARSIEVREIEAEVCTIASQHLGPPLTYFGGPYVKYLHHLCEPCSMTETPMTLAENTICHQKTFRNGICTHVFLSCGAWIRKPSNKSRKMIWSTIMMLVHVS